MKTLFTFLACLFAVSVYSQQNIIDVRNSTGQEITVTGIVTNGDEFYNIRYFQDETAGLAAYGPKMGTIKRGDSITISGTLKQYNNLLEIDPVETVTVHSSNHSLPTPKILSLDEIGENYEGQLVQINNAEIVNASGTFAGNQNYVISANGKTGIFRITSGSPIVGQVIPTSTFNLVAICSQYSTSNNNIQTGYQLMPRDMNDFKSTASVSFTSPVEIENIQQTGFTLTWNTNNNATSEVGFGMSEDKSTWQFISGTSMFMEEEYLHKVTISGLQPATILFAQPFSVLESDTVFSSVGVFATESNSTGAIRIYFNTEVDETVSTGILAQNIENAMEDTLIAYIDRAEETIDFCIYNINNGGLSNVSQALNNAKDRGVKIRFITCGSTAHFGAGDLDVEIPILERPEIAEGGIMHNKFVVFDAHSNNPDLPWVWTGSTNLTYDQINTDANNMILIQDQTLAKTYEIEFEEMWGSENDQPNLANAKFGAEKSDNTPHELMIAGNRIESYFSPSDNTNQKIIGAINSADNDLEIETMLITRSDIANAIRDAKQRGVEVQVITNYVNDNTQTVNDILDGALPDDKFIFDDLVNGMLHHKMAIIDANYSVSDPQVITGSHNWSSSANDKNDENTLIIHNPEIANIYLQQFAERFAGNGGNLYVVAEITELKNLKIYPNPVADILTVSSSEKTSRIEIFNLLGVKISEIVPQNGQNISINFQDKMPGIYLLNIIQENGSRNSYKIIKK